MTKQTFRSELEKRVLVPNSRLYEVAKKEHLKERNNFKDSVQWRIFRIMAEFVDGFEFLSDLDKSVTVFGSTNVPSKDHWYQEVKKLGKLLAGDGFAVVSGGGPGMMEAANRGAFEGDGVSVGLNIQMKDVQRINDYVNRAIGFHYFFTRKVMLSYSAQAYVFAPGGIGTLNEFFEILELVQTKRISDDIPIICLGKSHWMPLLSWIKKDLYEKKKYVSKEDVALYQVVNSAKEAFEIIQNSKPRSDVHY